MTDSLIEALGRVQVGDTIVVLDQPYLISEVVESKVGDSEWRNLVSIHHDREIVFEVTDGIVRRWDQIEIPRATVDNKILEYGGKEYERDDSGTARFTSYTQDGTEQGKVRYSVLEADSGNRISVEEADGETTIYFSKEVIPSSAIQVPR